MRLATLCCLIVLTTSALGAEPASDLKQLTAAIEEQLGGRVHYIADEQGRSTARVRLGECFDASSLALLERLPPITELEVAFLLREEHLPYLVELREVQRLRIESADSIEVARLLRAMRGLRWLAIRHTRLSKSDLEAISGLTALRKLGLHFCGITDEQMACVAPLASLQELRLSGEFTGAGIVHLGKLPELETLALESAALESGHLESLGDLPKLNKLLLSGMIAWQEDDLRHLVGIRRLAWLEFEFGSRLTEAGARQLRRLPNLKTVVAPRFGADSDEIARLRKALPGVRIVCYGPVDNPLQEFESPTMTAFHVVEEDVIGGPPYTPTEGEHFVNHLVLETKPVTSRTLINRVQDVLLDQETYNTNGGAGCFVPGFGLRVEAKGDGAADRSCEVLICLLCSSLAFASPPTEHAVWSVELWQSEAEGGNLSPQARDRLYEVYKELFGEAREGNRVYVRATRTAGDADVKEYFEQYEDDEDSVLVRVALSNSRISDAALVHFSGLKNLKQLSLRGTNVSDAALGRLLDLPSLKLLDVRDTRVSKRGVDDLKHRLPRLRVLE
ncbi:MAG: hypothetical protein RIC55_14820 [Pirellulaceae bacterium]